MQKGIIYVRVSDPGQVNGTSLDNQERACREYAEKNNIEVVRIFVEEGETATVANRTEFLKALHFCHSEKGKIQFFIVWKIDRFARNTDDHFAVRAKLKRDGVVLLSVTEPITQDPIGKLMETFLAGYAEFENEVRKQRCVGGMQGKLREGIWCWCPPIGYIHSKKIKDRRKNLPDIPDEERFDLIRKGLMLYKKGGMTLDSLTKQSNAWGLRTRTGRPMRKQLWDVILQNKYYAGVMVDPWTGEEHVGKHKPMIMLDDYREIQRVKRKMSNNAVGYRLASNPDFPLRQFVLCECNRPYTASWSKGRSKKYASYHCHNRQCKHYGHSVPKALLEKKFHEFLSREAAPSTNFVEWCSQALFRYLADQKFVFERQKQKNQSELAKLEKQRQELLSMRINKEISVEEFREMKDGLDVKLAEIKVSANQNEKPVGTEGVVSATLDFLKNVADEWKSAPSPYNLRLQRMILPLGITYHKANEAFGTAILSPIFRLNQQFLNQQSGLVAGAGPGWNQIIADINNLRGLMNEIHADAGISATISSFGQN